MDLIQEKFASVFSAYQVTTQARPDGGILLTLRSRWQADSPLPVVRAIAQCGAAVVGDQRDSS